MKKLQNDAPHSDDIQRMGIKAHPHYRDSAATSD